MKCVGRLGAGLRMCYKPRIVGTPFVSLLRLRDPTRSRLLPRSCLVDLNYLYLRHQVSLHRAQHAACERSRGAHAGLAAGYARKIAARRSCRLELVA